MAIRLTVEFSAMLRQEVKGKERQPESRVQQSLLKRGTKCL